MGKYIVGITGASGVVYAVRLLEVLLEAGHSVDLVVSEAGERVLREEMDLILSGTLGERQRQLLAFLNREGGSLVCHDIHNMGAGIASGSCRSDAMIVIPCTMGTLAAIANGLSTNLLTRAADVTLKEGRRLLLVPRETPLSAIHLANMLKLAELGVRIIPPVPAFYTRPQSVADMVDFVVGKVLDQLGIGHELYPRWDGT